MWGALAAILKVLLPWFFSGEKKTTVERSAPGLPGLDVKRDDHDGRGEDDEHDGL